MKILVIGFNALNNTSCLITKELKRNNGYDLLLLNYGFRAMRKQIDQLDCRNYDYVFIFGDKTKSTKSITFECLGINIQGTDQEILPGGVLAYKTNIGLKHLCQKLRKNNISCRISNYAGTHFCNFGYYLMLEKTFNTQCKVLFTHLTRYSRSLDTEGMYKKIDFIIHEVVNSANGGLN